MKLLLQPLFSPDDGVGIADKPTIKPEKFDDDTDMLNNLLDKPDGKVKDKDEEDEEGYVEKKDLLDDEEDDLLEEKPKVEDNNEDDNEDDEDDLLDTNIRSLDFKKIKEKYPDFAKTNEYRELKNSYHREGQLSEIFPTIDDAREAAENNETFNKLNDSIVNQGDSSVLLTAIKEANPDSVKRFAVGFLDNLYKFDPQLHYDTITPVVKALARKINAEGKKILSRKGADNEDGQALVATARNIMQYAFEDADLADKADEVQDPKLTAKEKELSDRERAIEQEKFGSAYQVATSAVNKHLDRLINEGLDPNNRLNEFVKDTLVDKIKAEVFKQLENDQSHIKRMNSLWKRASSGNFSRESLSSIVAAYLERARPVISSARAKYKTIALKGRTEKEESDSGVRISSKGNSGRAPAGKVNLKMVDHKKIDYRNTTDEDIFEGRVKAK